MTCKDCKQFRFCLEGLRMYPCKDFQKKEGDDDWQKDNTNTKKVKKHQDSHMD